MDSFTQQPNENHNNLQYGQPIEQPTPLTPKKKKTTYGLVSVFVGLVCVVIALSGMIKAIYGSFLEMPLVQIALAESGGENLAEEYDNIIEEAEEKIDNFSEEEVEEFEEASGISVEEFVDKFKTPSINVCIELIETIDRTEAFDDDEYALKVFKTIRLVILIYAALIALFALLAAILKNRTLSIIGLVISIAFFLLLAGTVFFTLYALCCVVHVVLVSIHKRALKAI